MSKSRNIPTDDGSPNYTVTKDPNVVMGKFGVPITHDDFVNANKNGYAWKDFPAYADYVGGWAKPIISQATPPPYYRAYGNLPNIPTADVEILRSKYSDNPQVQQALNRNIAKPGEIPQFASQDADLINQLITAEKVRALGSHDPNFGLSNAVANAKGN